MRRCRSALTIATAAATATALIAYLRIIRPWFLRWGATGDEVEDPLPGDDLVPEPALECTRAVTIHAPAEDVWPWLVQMGYGRGGFYSYDWLENAFTRLAGMRSHYRSLDRIVPELQRLEVGDFIPAGPRDWLGGRYADKIGWYVAEIEPGRALVLKGWGAFVLEPIDERTTRLIARSRGPGGFPAALMNSLVWELPHFIMERRMLLGIKKRAEALAAQHATA